MDSPLGPKYEIFGNLPRTVRSDELQVTFGQLKCCFPKVEELDLRRDRINPEAGIPGRDLMLPSSTMFGPWADPVWGGGGT